MAKKTRNRILGSKNVGYGAHLLFSYVMPFAAGFYVGMSDMKGEGVDAITRASLLAGHTVFNLAFIGSFVGLQKMVIRSILNDPDYFNEAVSERREKGERVDENYERKSLEKYLLMMSPRKCVSVGTVRPLGSTLVGYAVGLGVSKLT